MYTVLTIAVVLLYDTVMPKNLSNSFVVEPQLIDMGTWDPATRWERHLTSIMPSEELCSAAFCIALRGDKIVLMRAKRGWGMLGGHIEEGESVIDALRREALEEGGFIIETYRLCGYRKIIATTPSPHPTPGRSYPFPISHIPFYLATTTRPLVAATGEEVLETAEFSIDEVAKMNLIDWPVIKAVWDIASR